MGKIGRAGMYSQREEGESHSMEVPIRGHRGQRSFHCESMVGDGRRGWVTVTGNGRSRRAEREIVLSPQPHIVAAAQAVASHRRGRCCRSHFASGTEKK